MFLDLAERQLASVRLSSHHGAEVAGKAAQETNQRFDTRLTGVSGKGTWVRIVHPPVEGKVVRGSQGLDVGDRVRVELVATDVERGFIDFARRPLR